MSSSDILTGPGAKILTIDADAAGQRIDNFLFFQLKGVPK